MIFKEACWGIDIGKHAIKAIRIHRKDKNRLEINAVDRIEYTFAKEGVPSSEDVASALKTFISRNSIKTTDSIAVALPGQMALHRFIKVPQLATAEIEGSIIGEAKQQIPFPLEDVIWGYQKIEKDYGPDDDIEVGIFAIKKEIIADYLRDFDDVGLEVDILTIAPLAIFNFVKYEMDVPDNVVVIDIGAHHTDLVIIEGNRFYVRELGLGGNEVTKMLQDTFSIGWDDAENLKRKTVHSSQAQKIFKIMQPAIVDFVGEIQRSLGFYRSQAPGAKFSSMALMGEGTKLAGVAKYIGRQLNMKVHYFMDIDRVNLDRDINIDILQDHLPSFGISIGLALQGLGVTHNKVNLIPLERKGQKAIARKLPVLLVGALLFFLPLLFWMYDTSSHLGHLNKLLIDARAVEKDLKTNSDKARKLIGVSPTSGNVRQHSIRGYKIEAEVLASIGENRSMAISALNDISRILASSDVAGQNMKVHKKLLGPKGEELNRNQLRKVIFSSTELSEKMDEVNVNKLWILKYRTHVRREEDGSEVLVHNLVGAIVDQQDDMRVNLQTVESRLICKIREKFKLPGADTFDVFKGKPVQVDELDANAEEKPGMGKYYRFEIEWTHDLRTGRPPVLDKIIREDEPPARGGS